MALITFIRTDSSHKDIQPLVDLLDLDLLRRDGEEHPFFAQFNKLETIKDFIIAYAAGRAVGCGAWRKYADDCVEIKRMFVHPDFRSQGIALQILTGLESWAKEFHFRICILETGFNQPEAISLYKKAGYKVIPNYGPYALVENSVCMEKNLEND
jgi:GNAT superfamily N-acetyltransferase